MKLTRCHVQGFGRLAGLLLDFADGLNLVYAGNEGGKSTLQHFLVGLLYGQLRPDIPTQRRLELWVERYKPWNGSDYGGILWCRLADGSELEIRRAFGRESSCAEVRTATGEDVTNRYEVQRNGDLLMAYSHLKLSKELFESLAVIRENRAGEMSHEDQLRDRIANLAQSGDEGLSVRASIETLREALESIGSDRAPTRPYRQALDRVQALQEEKRALAARKAECEDWVRERNRLSDELKLQAGELARARREVAAARCKEARRTVRTLAGIDAELGVLSRETASLDVESDFPMHRSEDLNRLLGEKAGNERRLAETISREREAAKRLEQADRDLRELAGYAPLHGSLETEKITEWFVRYLSLSRQKDDTLQSLNLLRQERAAEERNLQGLGPLVGGSETDWERKARDAAEEQRNISLEKAALGERISAAGSALLALKRAVRRKAALGAAFIIAGIGLPLWLGILSTIWISLGGLFLVAGILLMVSLARSRAAERDAIRNLGALEAESRGMRDAVPAAQAELEGAVAESGFASVEEFLDAARRAGRMRQRTADLILRETAVEQARERIAADSAEIYGLLKESLEKAGLSCSPGNLRSQIDLLRANLRRYSELEARFQNCVRERDAVAAERAELAKQQNRISDALQSILAEAKVASPEEFSRAYRDCRRLAELREKESSRRREFDRLRGGLSLEQWRYRLQELESALQPGSVSNSEVSGGIPPNLGGYLPYGATVEDAERQEKLAAERLASAREEHARLAERVSQAFKNYRSAAEIEEDLALAERQVENHAANRAALELAAEILESLSRRRQEATAPRLNRAVEERFLRICGGRYDEVKITPDFQIWIRESRSGQLRPAESLSRGTQDQLYLAVRFGMLDLLTGGDEPCPCLLDEPFAAYDRERMAEAFQVLETEASGRQLLIFTCRGDVREQAARHGARMIEIPYTDPMQDARREIRG